MNRATFSVLACFLILFTGFSYAQKVKKSKALENKVFAINIAEKGKKDVPDELTFRGFKLKSTYITTKYEFAAAEYTFEADSSDVENPYYSFESKATMDKQDLVITGTITEDDIEGTATISKGGKVKKEFNFSGTLKNPKKKKK
jgi:hypothetical protein